MDQTDFSILRGRLERQADERPNLYTGKLALVAALGYAPPAALAIALLAIVVLIVRAVVLVGTPPISLVLLGVVVGLALAALVKVLIVRIEAPRGREVTAAEAPSLFAVLTDLASKMNAAPPARVVVHTEFALAMHAIPRWGVFGAPSYHLQIGLPLAVALTVEELTAVLAHEMGHAHRQTGRFNAWIYRQRGTWRALERRLAEPSSLLERAAAPFYGWYAPYFYAYSFVQARNQEYAADQLAAHFTEPQALGRALTKIELIGRYLDEVFWERFYAHIEKSPEPPYRPYSVLLRAFKIAERQWSRIEWLKEALKRYAPDDETHPSLSERLAALELTPMLPKHASEIPALALFGKSAPMLLDEADEEWRAENLESWRKRHDEIKEAHWKIAEYDRYELEQLAPEDLWAKAQLLFTVARNADGLETLRALTARPAPFPKAHFMLGQLLLERHDERGLDHLVQAAGQNAELARTAGAVGYSYLVNRGRKREALRFWERIQAAVDA